MLDWSAALATGALRGEDTDALATWWSALETGEAEGPAPEVGASDNGVHDILVELVHARSDASEAAVHTALAPWTWELAGTEVIEPLRVALGEDPAAALYDRTREHELPHSLKDLGLSLQDLEPIAAAALEAGIGLPAEALRALLSDAYHARRPAKGSRRLQISADGPHGEITVTHRGASLDAARAVLIALHGRGAAADRITRDLEAFLPGLDGLAVIAPQALDNTWYPHGFTAAPQDNQPFLDSALDVLDACWVLATQAVPPSHVLLAGFSQGGCLLLSWARLREHAPGALLAFSAAELDVSGDYRNLRSARVTLSKSAEDPWIPSDAFGRTADRLRAAVPGVEVRVEPGASHRIYDKDGQALAAAVMIATTTYPKPL